jgi:hypothetical protein
MTGEADAVSVVQGTGYSWLRLSVSEIHAAASKAFGTPSEGVAPAWKINGSLYDMGIALRAADERLREENLLRRRDA